MYARVIVAHVMYLASLPLFLCADTEAEMSASSRVIVD